eukprot:1151487-Pelagomonas_calceolata.AAC.1
MHPGSNELNPIGCFKKPRPVTLASSFQNRRIHLVEVKYSEDTRPKKQLEASSSSTTPSVTIFQRPQLKSPSKPFCWVWAGSSTPLTLWSLLELGLDTHAATKLALKLHTYSVQYAYKGYKGKRPQSRCLTASLFINTHEVMKKKRKFVVILVYKKIDILGIHMVNGA